jgi:hypothetical protein
MQADVCNNDSRKLLTDVESKLTTCHRAFDAGLIYADDQHRLHLNERQLSLLRQMDLSGGIEVFRAPLGQRIFLPLDPNQRPSEDFIRRGNRFRQIAV